MLLLRGIIASLLIALFAFPLITTIEKIIAADEAVFEDEQPGALPESATTQSDQAVFEDEERAVFGDAANEPKKAEAAQTGTTSLTSLPIQRPASPRTMNSTGFWAALPLLILVPIGFSVLRFSKPARKKRSGH